MDRRIRDDEISGEQGVFHLVGDVVSDSHRQFTANHRVKPATVKVNAQRGRLAIRRLRQPEIEALLFMVPYATSAWVGLSWRLANL